MSTYSFAQRFFGTDRTTRRQRRCKPAVEGLEDRLTPATFAPLAAAPDGTANSLRAAIIAANSNGQDDTITLEAGSYQLAVANTNGQENKAAEGDLDLTEAGHTVTIRGAGADRTVIDGGSVDRVFQVMGNVTVVLRDLTVTNGFARDEGLSGIPLVAPEGHGGGLLNQGTTTLDHVVVEKCTAAGDAGFHVGEGVNGSDGTPGKAASGGGIQNEGALFLDQSTVRNNSAFGGRGGDGSTGTIFVKWNGGLGGEATGGGIRNNGTLSLTKSRLVDNQAFGGAGGFGGAGPFGGTSGNGGRASGGALFVAPGVASVLLADSMVSGNRAIGGAGGNGPNSTGAPGIGGDAGRGGDGSSGGVAAAGGVELRNSTITDNTTAGGLGGAGGTAGTPTGMNGANGAMGTSNPGPFDSITPPPPALPAPAPEPPAPVPTAPSKKLPKSKRPRARKPAKHLRRKELPAVAASQAPGAVPVS